MAAIYWTYIVNTFNLMSHYRANIVVAMVGRAISPLVYLIVWLLIAQSNGGAVGAYGGRDLIAYYLLWLLVRQVVAGIDASWLSYRIRDGRLSDLLLRPLHPVHVCIAELHGFKLLSVPITVAITIVMAVVFDAQITPTVGQLIGFTAALVLAAALYFSLRWWVALLAFWTTDTAALNGLFLTLETFFGGRLAPIALLSPVMVQIANLLPFRWTFVFPIELLLGKLDAAQTAEGFAMQALWLVVCTVGSAWLWRLGIRQYGAVGG